MTKEAEAERIVALAVVGSVLSVCVYTPVWKLHVESSFKLSDAASGSCISVDQ